MSPTWPAVADCRPLLSPPNLRARTQRAWGAADGRARNGSHFRPNPVPLVPLGTARFIRDNLVSSVVTVGRDGGHKDPTGWTQSN